MTVSFRGTSTGRVPRNPQRRRTIDHLEASMPHSRGPISVSYRRDGRALEAKVTLPPGLTGEFAWWGVTRALQPGEQSFRVE